MPQFSLFDTDASTHLAVFDVLGSLEIHQKLRTASTFRLEMATQTANLDELTKGRYLGLSSVPGVPITQLFRIDQIERSVQSDSAIFTGRDFSGIFAERLVIPAAGQSHVVYSSQPTETIAKGLVNTQAGPGAVAVPRRVPTLTIESDTAQGPSMTVEGRFQTLAALLEEVLRYGSAGYEVVKDGGSNEFRYIAGTDRTTTVFLTLESQTVSDQSWLQSDLERRTTLLVAGQGEGADREIVYRHAGGVEPSGLERREALVDARDLEDTAALEDRGDSVLAEMASGDSHSATLHQYGSFRYGEDFWLGDIVTLGNDVWGLSAAVQVVGATLSWSESNEPEISVDLDRPWPTLKDKITKEAHGMSSASAAGAVDYSRGSTYTILTNYVATSDIWNAAALAAGTTTAIPPGSIAFTVGHASSIIEIDCRIGLLMASANTTGLEAGSWVEIDGVYSYHLGSGFGGPGIYDYLSPMAGSGTIKVLGLSAGAHSLIVYVASTQPVLLYLRAASQPNYEHIAITISEISQ